MIKVLKRDKISKRANIQIRLLAIFLALVTTGIFLKILGYNPFEVYFNMLDGVVGSKLRIQSTIQKAIPLIITSLGIMVAFKMKFWNIGAEGQIMMGAFSASFFALNYSYLPRPLLLIIMMIAGTIGGAIWALIPAFCKVKFNTNETIFTLMMNYIAIKWVTYLQYGPWKDPGAYGFPKIALFKKSALLPKIFGVHAGWLIAIILVILVDIFINHTKKGFEITVVGESINTARYSGMNVGKVIIYAMLVSGGLCGLTGMIQASSVERTLSMYLSGGYGYTAIITTWLSGLNAFYIVITSLFFAILTQGGSFIQISASIPQSVSLIIQSVILFFILGSQFFIQYKIRFRN